MAVSSTQWAPDNGASRAVALEVLIHGPISRSEIARRLELSQGSLTRLSTPLIESGLLVETDGAGADRRTRPLDVVPGSKHFVGLKLTGTEVLGALIDLRSTVRAFDRIPLTSMDPAQVVETMATLTERLGRGVPAVTAVGVGLGGLVENSSLVVRAPFLEWERVPLGDLLAERLGVPTVIENDVLAFTESEHWFGSGRGLNRFAVLTLGAGIGYGAVVNGKIVAGPDSGIGLVGHWPLDAAGPVCKDGHRGCAAAVLSTEGVERSVSSALGRRLSYEQCLDLAAADDPAARRIIDDAGRGLGRLIAAVANLIVPERIILGGEGVRLAEVAADAMAEGIARDRDPLTSPLDIRVNVGDEAEWCRGGGVIAIQTYVLGLHAGPA
ncbi:ROK family transcriptional regulator [Nakamurella endophytica]|uniref:MarR family transcriptional regulator n=1 Tax=Nakamurella endophytica TaxID=1748367 RepID=A0A917SPY3_9ACTN|nr:ROK family transcriptional regulator [Nakamurella endophytica]GGL91724.1 MarR family transcriptional regulator [Nakamurella endophytica]